MSELADKLAAKIVYPCSSEMYRDYVKAIDDTIEEAVKEDRKGRRLPNEQLQRMKELLADGCVGSKDAEILFLHIEFLNSVIADLCGIGD